ncbi:Scr1 family TA system antitoxin-like transcriptional regulator [Streptomyces sp. NPDC008125]|uniref:helix-turn-helix domain-containing protein n=1 Tax=Streptomyces sp. NPDC008125 TaxID=3364811 RepID=UPI0036E31F8F
MANGYGSWLKAAREAKGWSQEDLATKSYLSRSQIANYESGRRHPTEHDARALDGALGTGDVLTTFRPGQPVGDVPTWFEQALELEQQADKIHEFAPSYVPGILQTEAYATAVIESSYPRRSEEDRRTDVATRLERGKLLENPLAPEVWALLDEAVIRRPIGGRSVMAEQLNHIVRLAESGRIRVNVLLFAALPHPLLDGQVTLLWFDDQPPVAYAEGMRTGTVHDSPSMVTEIQGAYDLALSEAQPLHASIALLRAQAKEFEDHDRTPDR